MPGLDTWLTSESSRRPAYETREEGIADLTADILADRDRMLSLFEEDASQQDESELVAELIELRWLLSRPDSDERASRLIAIERKNMASKASELAEAEAKYQADNA